MAVLGHDVARRRPPRAAWRRCSSASRHSRQAQGDAVRGGQLRAAAVRDDLAGLRRRRPRDRQPRPRPRPPARRRAGRVAAQRARDPRGPPGVSVRGLPLASLRRPGRAGWPATATIWPRPGSTTSRTPRSWGRRRRCARSPCCRGAACASGGQLPAPAALLGAWSRPRRRASGPAVLYYHSYDFDGTLPGLRRRALAACWPGSSWAGAGSRRSCGASRTRFGQ